MVKLLYSLLTKKTYPIEFKHIVDNTLAEDCSRKDITTKLIVDNKKISTAKIIAQKDAILCGMEVAKYCFKKIDSSLKLNVLKKDGERVSKGDTVIIIKGKAGSILMAERIALNFLQHLSGVATFTNKFVSIARRYNVAILDTRKTIPGLRTLEKYAVFIGGGKNHRFNLQDEVLIKDNHCTALGGIENAIKKIKKYKNIFEIEVNTLDEFKIAHKYNIPYILLDNFKVSDIKKAVKLNQGKAKLEVSGNVSLKNIKKICKTGVDYISIGAVTHSAKAVDFSLKLI